MIEIYSRPDCIFCSKAKTLLNSMNISFTEHVLGEDYTRDWLMDRFPTARTYPVIIHDGFYIGGYTELQRYIVENNTQTNQKFLSEG